VSSFCALPCRGTAGVLGEERLRTERGETYTHFCFPFHPQYSPTFLPGAIKVSNFCALIPRRGTAGVLREERLRTERGETCTHFCFPFHPQYSPTFLPGAIRCPVSVHYHAEVQQESWGRRGFVQTGATHFCFPFRPQ
jgi:hypothetical protein